MSVREYIGARYLPLFPDDPQWNSANTYEPLTVVQNLGSSYISRQYVPAGIQLTNTDYWVLWADFNSQIEQYRAEVQAFDGRITANTNDIDALELIIPKASFDSVNTVAAAISANATDIDALEDILPKSSFTSVNTVKSAIDTINNTINGDLLKDYAVFIGDSYLRGSGSTDGAAGGEGFSSIGNGWGKTLCTMMGIPSSKVMCIGGGGAGFQQPGLNGGGLGLTFAGMIQKAAGLMTANQIERTRVVVILGGVNDGMDLTGADVDATIGACRTYFPHVPVHVFTNLGLSTPRHNLQEGNAFAYELMRARCALGGAAFHETWPLGLGSSSIFADDNIHCSSNGYTHLGRSMFAAINGGKIGAAQIGYNGYFSLTGETGVSVGSAKGFFDGIKHVEVNSTTLTINTETLPITGNSPITVATIPSILAPRFTIQGFAMIYGSSFYTSGTYGLMPCDLTSGGAIRLRRPYVVDTTTADAYTRVRSASTLGGESTQLLAIIPTFDYDIY